MALYYAAGFDTAQIGAFSVAVSGVASGTATVAAGKYCHIGLNGIGDYSASGDYSDFATAVQTALVAVNANFTCTYSSANYAYTISNPSNFVLTWNGTAGTNLRRALGFSTTTASATSATSDVRPYYLMVPQIDGRSQFTDTYEPDDIAEEAVSDGGTDYVISRDTSELWCDWVQSMETKAATLTRSAVAAAPWTWQDFFKHCRGEHPFYCGDNDAVYRLRADGASFSSRVRERVTADYDDLWQIRFFARDRGVI